MVIDKKTANYIFNELSIVTHQTKHEVMVSFYEEASFEPKEDQLWINQESVGYFDKRKRIYVRGLTLKEWSDAWEKFRV
ncbi:hypothetical protein IAE51_10775 [Lactococcus sp. S64]|uniref:hypothetical protein n=1 Tax=Lactococcus sp. S64 TaxID=2767459 RepID=UPI0019045ACF|nr:hypothetical protein [Lactococcus sp. S64]MBK0084377.1 hypothetical protein [Lactococcus sp. S64]